MAQPQALVGGINVSHTPIRNLSLDVILLIFDRCTDLDQHDYTTWTRHYRQLRDLALVSTHWKSVVIGTKALWTYIPFNLLTPAIQYLLNISRSLPLHIDGPSTDPPSTEVLNLLARHLHRWKSFKIYITPNTSDRLKNLLADAALPIIEFLGIEYLPPPLFGSTGVLPIIFQDGSRFPTLKTLHLSQVQPAWSLCAGLRSLTIHYTAPIPLTSLLGALQACPLLEALAYRSPNLLRRHTPHAVPDDLTPIIMPKLHSIELLSFPAHNAYVLSCLHLPPLRLLSTYLNGTFSPTPFPLPHPEPQGDLELRNFTARLFEMVSSCRVVYINGSMFNTNAGGSTSSPVSRIAIKTSQSWTLWVASLLALAQPPRIVWTYLSNDPAEKKEAISLLPTLQCVKFYGVPMKRSAVPEDLMRRLGAGPPGAWSQVRQVVIKCAVASHVHSLCRRMRALEPAVHAERLNLDIVVIQFAAHSIGSTTPERLEEDLTTIGLLLHAKYGAIAYPLSGSSSNERRAFEEWLQSSAWLNG